MISNEIKNKTPADDITKAERQKLEEFSESIKAAWNLLPDPAEADTWEFDKIVEAIDDKVEELFNIIDEANAPTTP